MAMVARTSGRQAVRNTRAIGTAATRSSSITFWKAGDSMSFSRTHRPTTTSAAESRNGRRQPQLMNCSSVICTLSSTNSRFERMNPIGAPSCGKVPYRARLPGGAFSVASSAAPDHSPPRPMPWQKRSSTRIAGARRENPGVEAVGSTPMRKVATPITSRLATSVVLRPTRSP